MQDYVVFDLETTGFSPVSNEIIEIGAWKVKGTVPVQKFTTLVKPRGYLYRDIQDLTGITNEMLVDALDIDEVLPSFIEFCGDLPLLGHNLQFDYEFICNKAKVIGFDFTLQRRRTGVDTLELSRQLVKNRSHKLQDMADYYKIQVTSDKGYHRAEYDAYITKLLYDRFLFLYSDLSLVTLPVFLSKEDNVCYGKAEDYGMLSFE